MSLYRNFNSSRMKSLTLGGVERGQRFGRDQQGTGRQAVDEVASGLGQVDEAPPAVFRMGPSLHQAAQQQAVDHALDGGAVHDGVAAEQVLGQRSCLPELGQGRPLRRRDVAIDPAGEDRGMALRDLAQDEADLVFEDVVGQRRAARRDCSSSACCITRRDKLHVTPHSDRVRRACRKSGRGRVRSRRRGRR